MTDIFNKSRVQSYRKNVHYKGICGKELFKVGLKHGSYFNRPDK
jgi:hypothetical protein